MRVPISVLSLILGPVRTEVDPIAKQEVLTHLQKYSRCGIMLTIPFCLHVWFFWRKQKQEYPNGVSLEGLQWVPGTEQGIYARTPGWRYDRDLGMIWTWGYCGLHWD